MLHIYRLSLDVNTCTGRWERCFDTSLFLNLTPCCMIGNLHGSHRVEIGFGGLRCIVRYDLHLVPSYLCHLFLY